MAKYIIVKYASELCPDTKVSLSSAAHPYTYTAFQCNVNERYFTEKENADVALDKMRNYNPTVDYGIALVDETI
jgi:hypothetical protein